MARNAAAEALEELKGVDHKLRRFFRVLHEKKKKIDDKKGVDVLKHTTWHFKGQAESKKTFQIRFGVDFLSLLPVKLWSRKILE